MDAGAGTLVDKVLVIGAVAAAGLLAAGIGIAASALGPHVNKFVENGGVAKISVNFDDNRGTEFDVEAGLGHGSHFIATTTFTPRPALRTTVMSISGSDLLTPPQPTETHHESVVVMEADDTGKYLIIATAVVILGIVAAITFCCIKKWIVRKTLAVSQRVRRSTGGKKVKRASSSKKTPTINNEVRGVEKKERPHTGTLDSKTKENLRSYVEVLTKPSLDRTTRANLDRCSTTGKSVKSVSKAGSHISRSSSRTSKSSIYTVSNMTKY